MFASHRLQVTTALFLFATALTSVIGLLFPIVGILACVVLPIALFAWHWIYVIAAVASLYLNIFVLVVQSFVKVSALTALAPTQRATLRITQAVVLAIFVLITVISVIKFRPPNTARV